MQKVNLVLDQHQARHLSSVSITHLEFSRNPRNSWKWCILCTEHLLTFLPCSFDLQNLHQLSTVSGDDYRIETIKSTILRTPEWSRSWLGSSWVTVQPPGSSFLLLLPEFWPFHCSLAHSLEGGEPRERRFYLPTALLISLKKNKVYKTNTKF